MLNLSSKLLIICALLISNTFTYPYKNYKDFYLSQEADQQLHEFIKRINCPPKQIENNFHIIQLLTPINDEKVSYISQIIEPIYKVLYKEYNKSKPEGFLSTKNLWTIIASLEQARICSCKLETIEEALIKYEKFIVTELKNNNTIFLILASDYQDLKPGDMLFMFTKDESA